MENNFEISHDCRQIYIKEDDYIFRNFFGSEAFTEGIHYWEIVADARTEHELKIGVSSVNNMSGQESQLLVEARPTTRPTSQDLSLTIEQQKSSTTSVSQASKNTISHNDNS